MVANAAGTKAHQCRGLSGMKFMARASCQTLSQGKGGRRSAEAGAGAEVEVERRYRMGRLLRFTLLVDDDRRTQIMPYTRMPGTLAYVGWSWTMGPSGKRQAESVSV